MGDGFPTDYEDMSNEELYQLLKERAPEVAAAGGDVRDLNRETVIAILSLLKDDKQSRRGR